MSEYKDDINFHTSRLDVVTDEVQKNTAKVIAAVSAAYAVLLASVATTIAGSVFSAHQSADQTLPIELFVIMVAAIVGLGGCWWLYSVRTARSQVELSLQSRYQLITHVIRRSQAHPEKQRALDTPGHYLVSIASQQDNGGVKEALDAIEKTWGITDENEIGILRRKLEGAVLLTRHRGRLDTLTNQTYRWLVGLLVFLIICTLLVILMSGKWHSSILRLLCT